MKQLLLIFIVMLSSCTKKHDESKDDKLILAKIPYSGTELKINGVYYTYSTIEPTKKAGPTFFYNNGFFLTFGCGNDTELIQCINEVSNNNWAQNSKSGWGLFEIEGTSLYYERWYPKSFGSIYKVFSHECEILNDTTYLVKKKYRLVNGQQTEVSFPNHTYHFVQFQNKPNSDNNFIP